MSTIVTLMLGTESRKNHFTFHLIINAESRMILLVDSHRNLAISSEPQSKRSTNSCLSSTLLPCFQIYCTISTRNKNFRWFFTLNFNIFATTLMKMMQVCNISATLCPHNGPMQHLNPSPT
ncbi:hypothetical protein M758_7G017500 [Ceratodon purpureus]|nr:hypothetical protein M758_7G017500 [Ceratodon purpureus]